MKDRLCKYENLLSGGDLRSIGSNINLLPERLNQDEFDVLFTCLFNNNRIIVMRAADRIEKITVHHPELLQNHHHQILGLCHVACNKELKWHLAQLLPRLLLPVKELLEAWNILSDWASDTSNSKIVRVNSLQSLFEISRHHKRFIGELQSIIAQMEKENIPSFQARIKQIKSKLLQNHKLSKNETIKQ